jgi:hypothetical protein
VLTPQHRYAIQQQIKSGSLKRVLSHAKIKSAFAMNNMQRRRVTWYLEDTEASRSFGE